MTTHAGADPASATAAFVLSSVSLGPKPAGRLTAGDKSGWMPTPGIGSPKALILPGPDSRVNLCPEDGPQTAPPAIGTVNPQAILGQSEAGPPGRFILFAGRLEPVKNFDVEQPPD